MPPASFDQKTIATIEQPGGGLILQLQLGRALQQHHPFVLLLVVPEAFRAAGLTGMDPLQPQPRCLDQHLAFLASRGGTGGRQQAGVRTGRLGRWGRALPPASADLEAPRAGQGHHLVMVAAVAQAAEQGGLLPAEGHKGIQLANFLQEPLQIGFGHGAQRCMDQISSLIIRQR
jgi:hypothetical protein